MALMEAEYRQAVAAGQKSFDAAPGFDITISVMTDRGSGRRISRLGVILTLAILIAVIAFGVFKRKGARKPPPLPEDASGQLQQQRDGLPLFAGPGRRI
jgi:preprotein translocase subunit SecG